LQRHGDREEASDVSQHPPAALPESGIFHGRYQIVRCIKAGGMGAIYEVIHLETRRRRALKIMLPGILANREMRARFKLEATVAADIESEHIVETFDAGVDDESGAPFLVMELLRGSDLGSLTDRGEKLSATDVVTLLMQAASALDKTHAAGVVHRDLKPENLFVARRDDGSPKLKILDFGIAKVVSEGGQAAARTSVLGTPLYMSPEQIRGDGAIGPRADLYALTHIAFTLLVGRAYWSEHADAGELYALMMKIAAGGGPAATAMAVRYGATLPAAFDAWFARGTASEPRERFETAGRLVEELAAALAVMSALPPAPPVRQLGRLPEASAEGPRTSLLSEPIATSPSGGASLSAALAWKMAHPGSVSGEGPAPREKRGPARGAAVALALAVAVGVAVGAARTRGPALPRESASAPTDSEAPAAASPAAADTPSAVPPRAAESTPPATTASARSSAASAAAQPVPVAGRALVSTKRSAPATVSPAASHPHTPALVPDDRVLLERR
jgi:eukaryotic-like serine/threonine-protein kinase